MHVGRAGAVFVATHRVQMGLWLALVTALLLGLSSPSAFAWNEGGSVDPARNGCGMFGTPETCHASPGMIEHSQFSSTTDKCSYCHTIHVAPSDLKLLPRETIKATCFSCHDGTGGSGVYGAIAARGLAVGAQHRIDTTRTIPGGDAVSGGSLTATFTGEGACLTCTDCHNPHDAQTVAPFWGDRVRTTLFTSGYKFGSRLLRKRPTGATTETAEYGADWCIACHKGRTSAGGMENHPAESRATTTNAYYYRRIAMIGPVGQMEGIDPSPTANVVIDAMGRTNRGYLMPVLADGQRAANQRGHYPICQQCHEDARNVGALSPDGLTADVTTFAPAQDGLPASPAAYRDPLFQNFPHETVNTRMLVETGDDLCTNCHSPLGLP